MDQQRGTKIGGGGGGGGESPNNLHATSAQGSDYEGVEQ